MEQAYSSPTGWSSRIWSGCEAEFHKVSRISFIIKAFLKWQDKFKKTTSSSNDCHCSFPLRGCSVFIRLVLSTEKIKVQRQQPSIPSVSQGSGRVAFLFRNLLQSASQNLSEKNVAVLTAPSFLERFCEADCRNSETK